MLFTSVIVQAQQSIISLRNVNPKNLPIKQQNAFNLISSRTTAGNTYIAQIGNLANLGSAATVTINLPFLNCANVVYTAEHVEYTSENDYYWYGRYDTEDASCYTGTIMLIAKNGEKFGNFSIDNDHYMYYDIGNGYQVVTKVDAKGLKCGAVDTLAITALKTNSIPNLNTTQTTTNVTSSVGRILPCTDNELPRLLVLYTAAAENIGYGPHTVATMGVHQANLAFRNSAMGNIGVQLVGVEKLNGFIETIPKDDKISLKSNSTALALRQQYNADLVILLTDGPISGGYGPDIVGNGIFGNSDIFDGTPSNAFGIVQAVVANSERVFAHELGHLMGGRHQIELDTTGPYEHAHRMTNEGGWLFGNPAGSIVNYTAIYGDLPGNVISKENFSNPDVSILKGGNKSITGTATANNARKIQENKAAIANFISTGSFEVSISASYPDPCTQGFIEAMVRCGVGPYNYVWERSINGISYTNTGINSDIFPLTSADCNPVARIGLFLRLTVTDATGAVRVVYWNENGGMSHARVSNASNTKVETTTKIITAITPNPSKGQGNIILNINESNTIKIVLTNQQGVPLKILYNNLLEKGNKTIPFNVSNILPGVYNIQVHCKGIVEAKTLIIN